MVPSEVRRQILDLQLFDGLSSFADDEADFVGGDEDLLDGAVAVHVVVEAGAVATLLHDLAQQPLGLTAKKQTCHHGATHGDRFSLPNVRERWSGDAGTDWGEGGFVPFVATTMKRAQDALQRWLSFLSFSFLLSKVEGNTHSMFSGLPVSVQGLSNIPPLSGSRRRRSYINSSYARPNENQNSDYSKVHL